MQVVMQLEDNLRINGPAQFLDAAEHVGDVLSSFLARARRQADIDLAGTGWRTLRWLERRIVMARRQMPARIPRSSEPVIGRQRRAVQPLVIQAAGSAVSRLRPGTSRLSAILRRGVQRVPGDG